MVDNLHHQYFNNALKIVLEAGEVSRLRICIYNKNCFIHKKTYFKILLNGFKSPKEISTKINHQDFVTQYDKLVEKTIIDNLLQLYPNHK